MGNFYNLEISLEVAFLKIDVFEIDQNQPFFSFFVIPLQGKNKFGKTIKIIFLELKKFGKDSLLKKSVLTTIPII